MEQAELVEKNDWLQLIVNWNNAVLKYEIAKEINKIQNERNIEEQSQIGRAHV